MAAKNPCTFGLRITGCVATLSAALALATARQSVHFSNVNMLMVLLASSNSAALSAICLERNGNFHAGWRESLESPIFFHYGLE
ncbi:hypothetical protein CFP56_007630 [Quercus suber]|uniref:Secreted protein n=1 Tax=Quercus suber TaxID=58331 RepID=A0AAW0L4X0_QUESU